MVLVPARSPCRVIRLCGCMRTLPFAEFFRAARPTLKIGAGPPVRLRGRRQQYYIYELNEIWSRLTPKPLADAANVARLKRCRIKSEGSNRPPKQEPMACWPSCTQT